MKMTIALVALLAVVCSGAHGRDLQQLPTLPAAVAPAPGTGPLSCALEYLANAGTYNTLIELVEAASESAAIAQILDSSESRVTLLAPTDSGIPKTLAAAGLTAEGVLAQPTLITQILTYHVLPSQITPSDLVDGYSFNTQLETDGVAQSVAVTGNGASATFVGKASSAIIAGPSATACNINIIPLDGLLLPSS